MPDRAAYKTKPALPDWTVLSGDTEGSVMTVPEGLEPIEGLIELLYQQYGSPRFSRDNAALQAALSDVRMQVWHSTTARWREAEGVDDPGCDWFSPNGDGRRYVNVIWYSGDFYDLGEAAEQAERTASEGTAHVG